MKNFVVDLLTQQVTWVALAVGIIAAVWIFVETKSAGKAFSGFVGGLLVALFCMMPETILTKAQEAFNWAITRFHF